MKTCARDIAEQSNQISLFDLVREEKTKEIQPCLQAGQTVFLLNLDIVRKGTISGRMWLCDLRGKDPYYGYDVDLEKGGHSTVWDTQIGTCLFTSEAEAVRMAAAAEQTLEKITPQEMALYNQRSFQYSRKQDQYTLSATIAKVGENRLYKMDFYTYSFLETYPTEKIRDKKYREFLNKIQSESSDHGGTEVDGTNMLETMYRSTDTLYASWAYAEHNGNPYKNKGGADHAAIHNTRFSTP